MERVTHSRILVFVPNWVGDAVMATPALAALRRAFPDAKIVALARPYVSQVLAGLGSVDEVRGLSGLDSGAPVTSLLREARALRAESFDLAVLMTNSFRTATFALLAGARTRLGYGRDGRGFLLTARLKPARVGLKFVPTPMIDYYLALAAALGASAADRTMHLTVTEHERASARGILGEFKVDPAAPRALVTPGAAFGSAKCWPPANFAALADALHGKGLEVLVVTAPRERDLGEAIGAAALAPLKPFWRADVSLGALKALISGAAVLVTNDSGPRHIGAALGIPLVTIVGPTDTRWSVTNHPREIILRKNVDCGPCALRVCPKDHRCMTLITPEEVLGAVDRVLAAATHAELRAT